MASGGALRQRSSATRWRHTQDIEEALGDDAVRVLPHALCTAELRIRLTRHHIAILEYRAEQDQTTISGVLAKEFDGIAIHAAELFAVIPDFAITTRSC